MVISHCILLRMRNISDKICRENQNKLVIFEYFFFPKIVPLRDNLEKYFLIPSIPFCYDDYFINMTDKHNNLLNPITGCIYVNFVRLHVSVIHMTIIRSVRAKEIWYSQTGHRRQYNMVHAHCTLDN